MAAYTPYAEVKYVFLSATIPNAKEFAEWIVKTKRQTCHLVYTAGRAAEVQADCICIVYPRGVCHRGRRCKLNPGF